MATEEETFDQIPSGEELFEGEIPKEEPKAEEAKPETEEAKEERQRDEKGRFVKAEGEETQEEPETESEPEPEQEAQPDEQPEQEEEEKPDHRVPLMELLNEREKRQEEQRRRETIEQQLWQIQQQLQSQQKPEEPIDIFADPQAYQNSVEQTVEQRMKAMEGNFSLRLAKAMHKEAFDEAWSEMVRQTQSGNDSMRQQVMASSDPGETLVNLYRQAKTFKEVDGDPDAWLEAKKQEWLKDPQVQAQILEAAKDTATKSSTQSRNPNVKLPPSVNKAGSSANQHDKADMSDGALWEHTL